MVSGGEKSTNSACTGGYWSWPLRNQVWAQVDLSTRVEKCMVVSCIYWRLGRKKTILRRQIKSSFHDMLCSPTKLPYSAHIFPKSLPIWKHSFYLKCSSISLVPYPCLSQPISQNSLLYHSSHLPPTLNNSFLWTSWNFISNSLKGCNTFYLALNIMEVLRM